MKTVRSALSCCLALTLALFFGSAKAETKPATPSAELMYSSVNSHYSGLKTYPDGARATCDHILPAGATFTAFLPATSTSVNQTVTCRWTNKGTPEQSDSGTAMIKTTVYECQTGQNWTLSGMTCSRPDCVSPETRNANTGICEAPCGPGQTRAGMSGQCVCDSGAAVGADGTCCPVAGSGGGAPMQWCYVDNSAASSCDSAGSNGCKVRCNNVTYQKGASGDQVQIYPKQALGQNCSYTGTRTNGQGGGPLNNDELKEVSEATKNPDKAKSPESCLAAGMGYVTGSSGTTCVPGGDTGVTKKETTEKSTTDGDGTTSESKTKESEKSPTGGKETETTTKTNPDGSTTTTTKTTTCDDDGTCKTTTTETKKDANGNATGSKSGSENKGSSEFCKENPDSELCDGNSDTCKDHPDRAGCKDLGDAPEEGAFSPVSVGPSSITPVQIGGAGSCPAGPPLPFGLGAMSFDGICQLAEGIRPIVLAMAWLSAGLILLGGFKEG